LMSISALRRVIHRGEMNICLKSWPAPHLLRVKSQ
jgi:hypothetical protein